MQIRYTKPSQIEVSGTAQELALVAQNILDFVGSSSTSLVIEVETDFDPSPYGDGILSEMTVNQTQGPVRVSVVNDRELQIEGSEQNLLAFASFFDFPTDSPQGHHSHYEYYEGNQWIAADSEPVIIIVT